MSADENDTNAEAKDPLVGQVLENRYEVLRRLGGGGMGTVYEGRHRVIDKRVAIKVLHSQHAMSTDTIRRFINEARAAASLGHRNIIDASDVGSTPNGEWFLILEYLVGNDLDQEINRVGALEVARSVRILKQVASALGAAHAKGIIHRDLKPENVFLVQTADEKDFVKVLDFGISKFSGESGAMTRKGAVLGTPSYMAPEQLLDSSKADARADVYAAGVMAYRMLSGNLPFDGESFYELATKVLNEEAPPLNKLRPALPPGLVQAIANAMAKKPAERCPSMEAFAASLEPFAAWTEHNAAVTGVHGSAKTEYAAAPRAVAQNAEGKITAKVGSPTESRGQYAQGPRHCPKCGEEVGPDPLCLSCGAELPDLRLGEVLDGRFRVDKLLGAGGMGRVYSGFHLNLQEPIAIKFLLGRWTESADARVRFKREALTLAKLRHPGIVNVSEFGEHQGEVYMVMELVKGRALREVVPVGKNIPISRAIALTDLVLQVLVYAHGQNVVHRDLKPENVMLMELGENIDRIKLLDFGLAVDTNTNPNDRLTAAGAVQGTPAYMSPEQCRGRDVGPATDVYAAAVMLYELICGEVPLKGETFADTIVQQMFVEPPLMRDRGLRPVTSTALENVVRAALSKKPEDRPTAAAFREQLQQVLTGADAESIREKNAQAKADASMLSRDERSAYRSSAQPPPPQQTTSQNVGRVLFFNVAPSRVDGLVTQLGVHGLTVVPWPSAAIPPAIHEGQPVRAMLLTWNADGQRMLAAMRARPEFAKLPIVAMDATDVAETPAIIRAGASDVAYTNTANDAVCKQLIKLLRRAR